MNWRFKNRIVVPGWHIQSCKCTGNVVFQICILHVIQLHHPDCVIVCLVLHILSALVCTFHMSYRLSWLHIFIFYFQVVCAAAWLLLRGCIVRLVTCCKFQNRWFVWHYRVMESFVVFSAGFFNLAKAP